MIKLTLYEIIKSIAKHSEDIYIYDFSSFNKEQDIHKLSKGVKKIQNAEYLDQSDLKMLNRELDLRKLELSKTTADYYGEKIKCFGLLCKNDHYALYNDMIVSVEQYSSECFDRIIDDIPFEKKLGLTVKEYEAVQIFSHCMLSLFQTFYLYNLVFLQYLCKCIDNMEYYCKKCLESMFLISFSEVPDHIEAIKYIDINERSLVLKKKILKFLQHLKAYIHRKILRNSYLKNF